MPITHAMWVHGHSVTIENPGALEWIWLAGFHARLTGKPGTDTWLHFAVPTPTIVNGRRLRIGSVMLRFRTTPGDAWVRAVHVYDGENRIAAIEALHDNPADWATFRYDVPSDPDVIWGVGISVNVAFAASGSGAALPWRIDFAAAGADFYD